MGFQGPPGVKVEKYYNLFRVYQAFHFVGNTLTARNFTVLSFHSTAAASEYSSVEQMYVFYLKFMFRCS